MGRKSNQLGILDSADGENVGFVCSMMMLFLAVHYRTRSSKGAKPDLRESGCAKARRHGVSCKVEQGNRRADGVEACKLS